MYYLMRPSLPDGRALDKEGCPFRRPAEMAHGVHMDDMVLWRADGSRFHAECWSHAIHQEGEPVGAVVTFVDITERYLHTAMLEYQANHDSLTDLPNRQLLHVRLEQAFHQNEGMLALLLIDLDRFKEVNDSLGHKSGDRLLKQLGPRLQILLGGDDTLARLGGDEFALLLQSIESADDAINRAQAVRAAIQEPFDLQGMRVQIDASIGIALGPEHGRDASTLLRLADVAMYQAKQAATGYAVYDRRQDAHSPRRLALMSDLYRAVANDEFVLYYQPKVDIRSGRVAALEALVRWQHPERGLLSPDQFVPLAELGEMIKPLTFWVVDQALQDLRNWRRQGETFSVAVNISARNLQDREFVDRLTASLGEYDTPPDQLQLEITESAIMTDPVRARETIAALDALGVSLAIDDFGTGYSSLSYLKQLPVDELKIDKSFVIDMEQDENDAVIVRSTVDLAHNLGLRVTAEGVERPGLWDILMQLDCDFAQGFHICRPVPVTTVMEWLANWRTANTVHDVT
jgi:diguanylate cyclase (GGDEF)-like protein